MDSEHWRKFYFYNSKLVQQDYKFNRTYDYGFTPANYWRNQYDRRNQFNSQQFQRVQKPKRWFRKRGKPNTHSQAARWSSTTGNQYRNSTPKHPSNFEVTIPYVFRFQTSSNSTQFAPSSADVFSQPSSCCNGIQNNNLQSNETGTDEDVVYLYTVQTKGDELIEVVDLSENSEVPSSSEESRIAVLSSDIDKSSKNRVVLEVPSCENSSAARGTSRKRKKSAEDLQCDICQSEYESVKSQGKEIFRARCGHMFCELCLKHLHPCKCPECDIFLQKLLKVYF